MRGLGRLAVLMASIVLGVVVLPAAASADTRTGRSDFGDHVVICEQMMGFNGEHNPGMHQGFAG
jgi:hypothetical protein